MKKEFIAPTLEAKDFTSPENIMFGIMLTSAGQNDNFTLVIDQDQEVKDGFKIWKGIK